GWRWRRRRPSTPSKSGNEGSSRLLDSVTVPHGGREVDPRRAGRPTGNDEVTCGRRGSRGGGPGPRQRFDPYHSPFHLEARITSPEKTGGRNFSGLKRFLALFSHSLFSHSATSRVLWPVPGSLERAATQVDVGRSAPRSWDDGEFLAVKGKEPVPG